jgi:histidinol-phosphate phosphatase family protein
VTSRGTIAAFVDRDGTIIRDASYVRDPADVVLLPGAADAIRALNERGVVVVVITNQSGIARGYLTADDYERVRARTNALVAAGGGRIDATYMCPHYPEITGPCDCRKPGLLLYQYAITEHDLDPHRSLFVGDRWRDVAPAAQLGGRAILLDVDSTPPEDRERARRESIEVAGSLGEAVQRFLGALPASDIRP